MGTLDTGGGVKRKIQIIDLTGLNASQVETAFNDNYGLKGWRIVQVYKFGTKDYIIAEKEY